MGMDVLLQHTRVTSRPHAAIRADDKVQFFTQFATVLEAGMPLLDALRLSADQSRSTRLAQVIRALGRRCSGGASLHGAMQEHPGVFDFEWVQVVRTGEVTGELSEVLKQLAGYIREAQEVRGKVTSAMIYPAILASVSLAALIVMLAFVVPTFRDLFESMGGTLPGITRGVIGISDLIQDRWALMLGAGAAAGFLLRAALRSQSGRRASIIAILCIPVAGDLAVQSVMQRFAMSLALLLRSGTPLTDALAILRDIFRENPVYAEAIGRIENRVKAGGGIADALAKSELFTPLLVSMVRVGEESGTLAEVLEQIARYYKARVTALVGRLMTMLEPVIIVGMGGAVAILLMAIYLPMFNMAGGIR